MGHFLDVAYKVLVEANQPLSANELTRLAVESSLLRSQGQTPEYTMKARLSTDILNKKERSLFMRTKEGMFALRKWMIDDQESEFIAQRFTKGLLDEEIVVFKKSSLFNYISRPGYHLASLDNANGEALLAECYPMQRRIAEENFEVIQLISVFILSYNGRYLTYKRTRRLPESRLHDYYSIAFGGHLNPDDALGLFNIFQPATGEWLLRRELSEEVIINREATPKVKYKGLIYDDTVEVSSQHLGIVYEVFMQNEDFKIGERGFLMNPKFETISEIEGRISDFENWSIKIVKHERGQSK